VQHSARYSPFKFVLPISPTHASPKQTGRNATHRIGIKFLFSALITDELTLLVCVKDVRVATELDATPCRGVRDARLRSAPLTMMRGRCRGHISDMHGPHSPDHPAHVGATGNEGGTEDNDAPSLCMRPPSPPIVGMYIVVLIFPQPQRFENTQFEKRQCAQTTQARVPRRNPPDRT
jgi:hypothetical protein